MTCGVTEAECRCELDAGHDGPHHCTRDNCNGQWYSEPFEVVRWPRIFYAMFPEWTDR